MVRQLLSLTTFRRWLRTKSGVDRAMASIAVLAIVTVLAYLLRVADLGYYKDDWYLMYAAGAKGAGIFREIFSIDRPLRALVMIPAYALFGPDPIPYNLSAAFFRLVSAVGLFGVARRLWPRNETLGFVAALLYLVYPGFLSQPNGIDYLCHMAGLAAGFGSVGLTISAMQARSTGSRMCFWLSSALLGWFYLGQIEWYVGLEVLRFGSIFILAMRGQAEKREQWRRFAGWAFAFLLAPAPFLIWRLFMFESGRGATDAEARFRIGEIAAAPVAFIGQRLALLADDLFDVLVRAWIKPLVRLGTSMPAAEVLIGLGVVAATLAFVLTHLRWRMPETQGQTVGADGFGLAEALVLGALLAVGGLVPVVLVGRSVEFGDYSRYTLIAAAGAALVLAAALSAIAKPQLRSLALSLLVGLAVATQYANAVAHVREFDTVRRFWFQVAWRIPQLDAGTTLLAHYPVETEEDYFVWGPANLLYYPAGMHPDYVQPGIYAALLSEETVEKVLAREPQEFSNRRGVRTYPNFRNVLVLTQPATDSCVQVVEGTQVELSSSEGKYVTAVAVASETEHVRVDDGFRLPPAIPFGPEPAHDWCYTYEKAAFYRQLSDWTSIALLGDQALAGGLVAADPVEWLPFVQAYANLGEVDRLEKIAPWVTADPVVADLACGLLRAPRIGSTWGRDLTIAYCGIAAD